MSRSRKDPDAVQRGRLRCAVYTRKSSEEGLEQEFNSLDAQREACEAFIRSQKHEGWVCLPDPYDDGGISGATMERPALQRLLADIRARKVQVVVVYKVDRLTRSLSDFARIVEIFDQRGVSFVSVTQQFNTTSSMGRLTLNVLLSFAQFEREVTGERIRDKIAASKKKGMWMGGTVPLGFDVRDRKLLVNETEAETVRLIFRRYAELGSVHALKHALDAEGITSKCRIGPDGRPSGGNPIARGALYTMLQNPLYVGEVRHGDKRYPGEHAPIIDRDLWERVQARLAENTVARRNGARSDDPSLLAGLLYDEHGQRMIPSHARKAGRRYRYYVSKPLVTGSRAGQTQGRRLPAGEIERIAVNRLRAFLTDQGKLFDALRQHIDDPNQCKLLVARGAELAEGWPALGRAAARSILLTLLNRIEVHPDRVELRLLPEHLGEALQGRHAQLKPASETESKEQLVTLVMPAKLRRTGIDMRLIVDGDDPYGPKPKPDPSLVRLILRAHQMRERLVHNEGQTLEALAAEQGIVGSYFTRVVRLAWLSPEITAAILEGKQPPGLTAAKLLRSSAELPDEWTKQAPTLGFR